MLNGNFRNSDGKRDKLKFILAIGVIIYFVLIAIFEKELNSSFSNNFQMNIYLPWGFIAIFISFYIFREFNRVKKAKRDERRDELNERRQELLDKVLKSGKKKDDGTD